MAENEHELLLQKARQALDPSVADRARVLHALDQRMVELALGGTGSGAASSHGTITTGLGASSVKAGAALLVLATGGWLAFSAARTQAPARTAPALAPAAVAAAAEVVARPPQTPQAPTRSAADEAPRATSPRPPVSALPAPAPAPPMRSVPVPTPGQTARRASAGRERAPALAPLGVAKTRTPAAPGSASADATGVAVDATGVADHEPRSTEAEADEATTPRTPPPSSDHLAEELVLIQLASRALTRQQPAEALEQLRRHEAIYGAGGLEQEREGLTAIATCALGRVEAARQLGKRFLQRYPHSALAERVRSAADCE